MNQQTRNILFMVSSIAVIIGAAMPLFMLKMPWVPYIYAFGAAGMAGWGLQTHIPLQREKFPVKKTLPHRNILLSLFGSLFIFHVQRRPRLDYVAYCRCCPTIIYIDSHSASIKERRKISYSQTPPLPYLVALRSVTKQHGEKGCFSILSPAVPRSLTGCFASQNIGEGSVRTEGLEKYRQWQ